MGLKIPIYADNGTKNHANFIVGANEEGFHLRNVNFEKDFTVTQFADLRSARAGDQCPESNGKLKSYRGIEVGHVFYLGQKYAQKMDGKFLDQNGKAQFYEMGCYGIGVTRTIQAAIEQSHDADGIIWPKSIAPFQIHVCLLDFKDPIAVDFVEGLAKALNQGGATVFIDDRDERPGVKFKDADLMGFPLRITVGKKGLEADQIEITNRKTKAVVKVAKDQVAQTTLNLLKGISN